MVTYQIQLPEANVEAFLNIIRSLQSLGVISSVSQNNHLAHPGGAVQVDTLLTLLKSSKKQAEEGNVIPAKDVIEYMKAWKASR